MKKEKNDFPLRTAAKEIKISFVLTAVVDLILGVILLFAPEHVTDVLVMLISAGITIYGVFNILSFIFSRGMTAYSFELLIGICATAFGVFPLSRAGGIIARFHPLRAASPCLSPSGRASRKRTERPF